MWGGICASRDCTTPVTTRNTPHQSPPTTRRASHHLQRAAPVTTRNAPRQSPLIMHCSQHHKNSKQSTFNTLKITTDYQCGQQHGSLSPFFVCPETVQPSVYRPASLCLVCSLLPLTLVNVPTVCTSTCLHLVLAPSSVPHFYFFPCISDLSLQFYSLPEASPSWQATSSTASQQTPHAILTTAPPLLSLSCNRLLRSIPSHPNSFTKMMTVSFHLCPHLPSGPFPSGFHTKTVHTILLSPTCAPPVLVK